MTDPPNRLLFDRVLSLTRADARIRAVILNGSRANPAAKPDRYQDWDLVVLVTEIAPFIRERSWLDALGARNDLRWMWKAIPAAYFDQIYALEARHSFTGPGPGLVDGIETLAGLLHPDRHPAPLAALALRP